MSDARPAFEELDYAVTQLGALVLRRRRPPSMPDRDVYEVTLAGRFLMSSLVTASEEALAARALAASGPGAFDGGLRVCVVGLGLGHTAAAALDDPRVGRVEVVELLPEVVRWHEDRLVPLAGRLLDDPRCEIVVGDGFARLGDPALAERFDAVMVDVDDAPDDLLQDSHAGFYAADGLRAASRALVPGGVLAVWTARPPIEVLAERFAETFDAAEVAPIRFHNPLLDVDDVNAVYLGRRRAVGR